MSKTILKVIFVIVIFLTSISFYVLWNSPHFFTKLPQSVQRIKNAKWEGQIHDYIVSKTGEKYFENNFEILDSKYIPGGAYGPMFVDEQLTQKFEFLPFSGKYNYEVEINYSITNKETSGDLPPCVLEKSEERCNFPVSFSQAYDVAISKLGNPNVSVKLVSIDGNYKWSAIKTVGDPLCGAEYTSFTIDPYNASESQIQKRKSNFCI